MFKTKASLSQRRKILLVEVVIFGLIAGAVFGLYVEYTNYARGNVHWENKPESFSGILSQVLFGTFPLGIFIGYAAFGLFVALTVYYLSKRVHVGR